MADPPAPAMSRAVATGAASRTMASTIAAPVADSAPSWRLNDADVQGDDHRRTGSRSGSPAGSCTLAMNQHWSRYSCHQCLMSAGRAHRLEGDGEHVPGLRGRANCRLAERSTPRCTPS